MPTMKKGGKILNTVQKTQHLLKTITEKNIVANHGILRKKKT